MERIINEMTAQSLFDRGAPAFMPAGTDTPPAHAHDHAHARAQMPMHHHHNGGDFACDPGLGICYVPMQTWEQVYDEDTAFSAGTIFPCLNKPFLGGGRSA